MTKRLFVLTVVLAGCSDYSIQANKGKNLPAEDGDTAIDSADPGDTDDEDAVTGAVKGRVCDLQGDGWVVGALAYIDLTDGTRLSDTTDADGYFLIEGIPLGTHTIHVEKGSFSTTFEVTITEAGTVELVEEECLQQESVKIAVITGEYDSIQTYLADMGLEYDTFQGRTGTAYLDFLLDPDQMAEYDIIFLNCGISDGWFSQKGQVGHNIKEYVEAGGSIYSSDWAHYFFEAAFPDAVDYHGNDDQVNDARVGQAGHLTATVLDANMEAIIGSSADLNYNLGSWVIADSAKSTVDVLLRGTAPVDWWYGGGSVSNAPLAVRMEKGGTAIYTTFHNEAQATIDMEALLEEIILSL